MESKKRILWDSLFTVVTVVAVFFVNLFLVEQFATKTMTPMIFVLGSALDMSFLGFIFYNGKPGMFFMVELGAVLSAIVPAYILIWILFGV